MLGGLVEEDEVADGLEEDGQGHEEHDQSDHGQGDHLEDAGVLGYAILGEHTNLLNEFSCHQELYKTLVKTFLALANISEGFFY